MRPARTLLILLLIVAAGGLGTVLFLRSRTDPSAPVAKPDPLPILGELPDFALTDHEGRRVDRESLRGAIWVADFIFTRCDGSCPKMTNRMFHLQSQLREWEAKSPDVAKVKLITVSVDPERDDVATLSEYARFHHAEPRWRFLTGDRKVIQNLGFSGFKVSTVEVREMHSRRFLLVDGASRVRGYYAVIDDDGPGELERLSADLKSLLAE